MKGLPIKLPIKGVKHVVAVASGKGGVGKSTVAVNLAISSMKLGQKAAVLDADVFGPSIPKLLKLEGRKATVSDTGMILPIHNYGLQTMSMGFLVENHNAAIVWRGLMVMKAMERLIRMVEWDNVEVLYIDLPPGTGDTQLSICQLCDIDGAVIVSTPQDIALIDAQKGIDMFSKMNIPVRLLFDNKIVGLVQNMSIFSCPNCGHQSHIFGKDGVSQYSTQHNISLLGEVSLNPKICTLSDTGYPISLNPDEMEFSSIARKIVQHLNK